jgi:hypothetical protein
MLKFCLPFMNYRSQDVEDTSRNQLAQLPTLKLFEYHYSHFSAEYTK